MKLKTILSVLFVTTIFSAVCFAEGADKVDLKLRLKAGESREMKITQTQNTSTTANGREGRSRGTQEMVVGLNVLSVAANGNMDVEIVCRSIKVTADGNITGKFEFDSANPKPVDSNKPEQKRFAPFSALAGSKIKIRIKPAGEFYDVRGFDAIIAKVKEKFPEMNEKDKILNVFYDEKVKEMAGNILGVFPAGPVVVGDSWHKTAGMSFIPHVPRDVDITYTLKQRKDGIAYIDAAAKFDTGVKTDHNSGISEQSAGTIQSSIEMDEATGLTRKSNIAMNISGEAKMAANQQMLQGMKASSTIQGNTVVELIK